MKLKEVMDFKNIFILGDTVNEEKYAYKIKLELLKAGYNVACAPKELMDIDDAPFKIDVLDLCIHPAKGIKFLQASHEKYKVVVIQPGAESPEIISFLQENNIEYLQGCLLAGLELYKK